jgi:hypothetical protein
VGENQTREEDLAKADPWTEGTGIFGVPDPETREVTGYAKFSCRTSLILIL